jgi:hypothetical protein
MPNRPSTPIRTVINGVYGTVAQYEIDSRTKTITSQKKLEKYYKPSRGHTRASTMACGQVLTNTLSAAIKNQESAAELFKLKKFSNVESRVGKYHANPMRKSRQSV